MGADGATVTVLGAGSILPRAGYGSSGYALRTEPGGPVTLLDCGPGTVRALGAAGIGLGEIRRVVLSHYHADHCLDLLALAFARRNPAFEPPRLEVRGPRGLRRIVDGAPAVLGHWVADPDADVREVEVDADGRGGFSAGGVELTCARTGHTPEAVCWRADLPSGASLVYSGDSGEAEALVELARGADLFLCECSFPDGEAVPHHLTPSGAGRVARAAGVHRLVLTHFYPSNDPERARETAARVFGGPVEAARDGSVFEVRRHRD